MRAKATLAAALSAPFIVMGPCATASSAAMTMPPDWTSASCSITKQSNRHALHAHTAGSARCVSAVEAANVNRGPRPQDYRIPPGTPARTVAVIRFALAQLGKPYVLGGRGPSGFDCSGLVQAAYGSAGVRLPRMTYQQVHEGRAIHDTGRLLPGDLLFLAGSDGTVLEPGHVGMYLGDGLLISAPHHGDVVKISPLSWWMSAIAQVRRIL